MVYLPSCLCQKLALRCLVGALLVHQGAQAVYNDSIFSFDNSYPVVWWAVSASDRPTLANNAIGLRQDTIDTPLFARSVIVSLASGQRNEVRACCLQRALYCLPSLITSANTAVALSYAQIDLCLLHEPFCGDISCQFCISIVQPFLQALEDKRLKPATMMRAADSAISSL